jgi:hypothetical protein
MHLAFNIFFIARPPPDFQGFFTVPTVKTPFLFLSQNGRWACRPRQQILESNPSGLL